MAQIIWTPYALEDLQSIYNLYSPGFTCLCGEITDKLINKVEMLTWHREAGRIVPEFENEYIREIIEGAIALFIVLKYLMR